MLSPLLYRVAPLACCLGMLILLRWSGIGAGGEGPHSATIAVGFLLIGAFLGGVGAARLGLPRITGYLLVGVVVGPYLSGLLTADMLAASSAIEGVAVSLIALTAGGEIKLDWVKARARKLGIITFTELVIVAGGVLAVVLLGRAIFPFMPTDDMTEAIVIAMVFGAIAVADSPMVTIAVIAENNAQGPVSRIVLGVVVLKDVLVIILFAIALTVARDILGAGAEESLALTLLRELGGSVLVGVAIGIAIALFLQRIGRDVPVFILLVSFAIWQIAASFHLESLIIALTAGFWVENFSKAEGHDLIHGIEKVSLPVYALFFAAAGAKVDLGALAAMWPLALLLSATRGFFVWAGTAAGTRLARAEPAVRKYAWTGFISQAGVTLALVTIVARAFPTWGAEVQVIFVAMIALHELVGPIAFQYGLRKAGETGAGATRAVDYHHHGSEAGLGPPTTVTELDHHDQDPPR